MSSGALLWQCLCVMRRAWAAELLATARLAAGSLHERAWPLSPLLQWCCWRATRRRRPRASRT